MSVVGQYCTTQIPLWRDQHETHFAWFSPSCPLGPGHSSADITWQTQAIHPEPHSLLCPTGFVIQFDWVMPWAPGLKPRLLGFAGKVGWAGNRDTNRRRKECGRGATAPVSQLKVAIQSHTVDVRNRFITGHTHVIRHKHRHTQTDQWDENWFWKMPQCDISTVKMKSWLKT